eukprot:697571-Pyramimonas_sp.AAC.1
MSGRSRAGEGGEEDVFCGLPRGCRRHRWIRLDILVRTRPRRGLGSSGIGHPSVPPFTGRGWRGREPVM